VAANAQIARFQHIIVVVQENRTPDNLFQGLCIPPFGMLPNSCSTTPNALQYNIQTPSEGWLDKGRRITPETVSLAPNGTTHNGQYDLHHDHNGFVQMCDASGGVCKMDGANYPGACRQSKGVYCPPNAPMRYVDNSTHILDPYLQLASQYGWANYMFQTNQGPSFPAHQFLFTGTSAPTKEEDHAGVFAAENMSGSGVSGTHALAGCTAPDGPAPKPQTRVMLIDRDGNENTLAPQYPCFEHDTMSDKLPASVSWRYYAPNASSIWTAPNAIKHICMSTGPGGHCTGKEWIDNVDLTSSDVLRDINNCNLRAVSWVIPTGWNSDHANDNDGGGPSWVAAIINGIGHASSCDNNTGYWNNTAIFITWDDWGGWYDHEPPTILGTPQGGYQYGFRVPLLVLSAYTRHLIDNQRHDFGSILRFIEQNFGVKEGVLTFSDERAQTDLTEFFDLRQKPRPFVQITAPKSASFFLKDKRPATDPDDQ